MTGNKTSPLTRAELAQLLRDRLAISQRDANSLIESALEVIAQALSEKRPVSIQGLGAFQVRETSPRPGRNPKTGVYAEVPGRCRPTFTMGRAVKESLLKLWGPLEGGGAPPGMLNGPSGPGGQGEDEG
jgi:integration host factor subunit alpha